MICAHAPLPREDGIPIIILIMMQTATLFLRLIPNRSIKEDTIASIIEMELVNAAKNTSTKNKIPMIVPAVYVFSGEAGTKASGAGLKIGRASCRERVFITV